MKLESKEVKVQVELASIKLTNVLIYEYGARLDKEAVQLVQDQLFKANCLYNEIVACMRDTLQEMAELQLEAAGDEAKVLQVQIEELNQRFDAAKAKDDRDQLQIIAAERREVRRELWSKLKAVRGSVKEEVKPLFARIGRNSSCRTYQLRSAAVAAGLGWATANATLDAALNAWKKTIKRGQAPRFSRAADKTQRALTLQFTKAGGIAATDLLAGRHMEAQIRAPAGAGPRRYGQFAFRLGAAAAKTYATGTWQYHRPLPEGASVGLVRLVVRRHADKLKYALQLMVKLPEPVQEQRSEKRRPLVAVHMGWASDDVGGRRVAGLVSGADPGLGAMLQLPQDVEADLLRADDLQSMRDEARNGIVVAVKAADPGEFPEAVQDLLKALRRLPPEHIPPRRLYGLVRTLDDAGLKEHELYQKLVEWRREDRKVWQAREGIAERARNRRRDFYRQTARDLVNQYDAVAYEPLSLAEAALKLDEHTGEKTDFAKAARAGRFVAALSELEQSIIWACTKTQTPLITVTAPTVSKCPYCAGQTAAAEDDWHRLVCGSCGADVDRKLAGAANAWQAVEPLLEELKLEFQDRQETEWLAQLEEKRARLEKMAEGRAKSRKTSTTETANV